jgi:hypothetical protein
MRKPMNVAMATAFGKHLQGKLPGKRHFAKLCDLLSSVPPGTAVFLDFRGVEVVTGSWVNALFGPFFQWAGSEETDLFPVICNLAVKEWVDEFALVAEWTHRCFLVAHCPLPAKRARVVGPLDPGQKATLSAVLEFGPVTGAELERQWKAETIKATAWNNRLRDLYDKRIIRKERRGREQVYSTVLKEIEFDG